ncbi:MAG: hypothetical protein EBY17_17920 [Acidobacteriia bacterium]|nr:hypothetical protein [Terriglobia bacterium]
MEHAARFAGLIGTDGALTAHASLAWLIWPNTGIRSASLFPECSIANRSISAGVLSSGGMA